MGGAGTYSALGARLVSPPPLSESVGWVVDAGFDFPEHLRTAIRDWNTSCIIRETPERLTTRGWNGYGKGEQRGGTDFPQLSQIFSCAIAFKYQTPKLRLDHDSLSDLHLKSMSFHLICSPTRCIELVAGIKRRQEERGLATGKTIFIWEPVPDLCIPEEFENCLEALKNVDVISPNHDELGSFLGQSLVDSAGDVDVGAVRSACSKLKGSATVVVRAGKAGCYISSHDFEFEKWFPSFHNEQNSAEVVDPTGGGNTFLGGFAIGLVRASSKTISIRLQEAAISGSVAASFAIEQVGVPILRMTSNGEVWNNVRVPDRLDEYRRRLEIYIQPSILGNSQGKRLV